MKFFIVLTIFLATISLQAAELVRFRGNVTVNGNGPQKGQMLMKGDVLVADGAKSFFVVRYKDGTRFMIKNGRLEVDNLDRMNKKSSYKLIKGYIFSYVNPKSKQNFKIKTKHASMAVRGTKFWLNESASESYLCVCEGSVEVKNDTGLISIGKNQDIHIDKNTKKLSLTPANPRMLKMALSGLKELGVSVNP
jgi:hypothetical protein